MKNIAKISKFYKPTKFFLPPTFTIYALSHKTLCNQDH